MKSTRQHLDALLAVEADSQFDDVPKSLVKRVHQKQISQSQQSKFEWIKTSRELSKLELTISEQVDRMQSDIGLSSSPRSQEQPQQDPMVLVIGLIDELSHGNSEHRVAYMKQRLAEMEQDLEQQCVVLEAEAKVQRQKALQLVSEANKQCIIPPIFLNALNSLRMLGGDDDEVEILKQEVLGELEAAKHTHDKLRRNEQIKKMGMEKVEHLRKRIIEKSKRSANQMSNTKQQETHAKLKLLQLQQQLNEAENHQEASCSPGCKAEKEKVVDMKKQLESIKTLAKYQLECVLDHDEKENAEVFLQEELMKQRKMQKNKERTAFREEQTRRKLIAQQEIEQKKVKARELELERLSKLALSCPYQRKIADLAADIHKSTNARQNDFFRRQSDLKDFQLNRHTSFSDEKLFSDPKFRLSNELHKAGLNGTVAARDVIRNAIPRTEARTTGIRPY